MGPIDALIHLLNLFTLPLGSAAIAALLARRFGGAALRATPLKRLFLCSGAAASLVVLLGLLLGGRDGRLLTWGVMVAGIALALQRATRPEPLRLSGLRGPRFFSRRA